MSIFVSDTFTDTSGTDIASHTGEVGATWTMQVHGTGSAIQISDANRVHGITVDSDTSAAIAVASGTPGSADGSVEADFVCKSDVSNPGIIMRWDSVGKNGYLLTHAEFHGWQVRRIDDYSATQLGTDFGTEMMAGQTVHATLSMTGSAITVTLDGTTAFTGSDATYAAAGQAGIYFTNTSGTNSTGIHLDNFVATDAGGGGGGGGTDVLMPAMLM